MLERIRPIREKGIEILLVDASNCQPREVEAIARTVPSYVTTRPRGSVLLLVDFSGASIDSEALRTLKESAVFDKPYIKRAVWIGAKRLLHDAHEAIRKFARREMPIFENRQEALDWLLQD